MSARRSWAKRRFTGSKALGSQARPGRMPAYVEIVPIVKESGFDFSFPVGCKGNRIARLPAGKRGIEVCAANGRSERRVWPIPLRRGA